MNTDEHGLKRKFVSPCMVNKNKKIILKSGGAGGVPISANLFLNIFNKKNIAITDAYGFLAVRQVILQYRSNLISYLQEVGAAQLHASLG